MSKFPVTRRDDVAPAPLPTAEKRKGESFNNAMNPPNDPQKRYQPSSFNVTADYCDDADED
jgi:hypothetical protein